VIWQRSVLLAISMMAGLLIAVVGVAMPTVAQVDISEEVVYTDQGPVRGVVHGDHRSFQGIPYAAAPVGDLRWRPPQPPQRWREPLDATAPRSQCAQLAAFGLPESYNEDCLYLNVTTPHRSPSRLPVMMWIHGGGYLNGNGAQTGGWFEDRNDDNAHDHHAPAASHKAGSEREFARFWGHPAGSNPVVPTVEAARRFCMIAQGQRAFLR
jgi:hypothetical protein